MGPLEEGKLIATVEQLTATVAKLTDVVEKLEAQQNYWKGAFASNFVWSGGIAAAVSAVWQWFHK